MKSKFYSFIASFLLASMPHAANAITPRPIFASSLYNGTGYLYVPTATPYGNRACFFDSNSVVAASSTTDVELAFVHGVTSPIQTQLNSITGSAITAIFGDLSATGPGSVNGTVNFVGGSSAANVHSAELAANAATAVNTASTILKRDGAGQVAATTFTGNLTGNASGSAATFTGSLSGDVTGTQSATAISSATITGKLLTGYSSTTGTVTASDSILTGIGKLNGNAQAFINQKAQPNGLASLDSGGLLLTSQLPPLSITNTFVDASQAAMLAEPATIGDVSVRTDINSNFILQTADPTILGHWVKLLTPAAPVQTVNGYTGNVVLTTSDIAEGSNLYYTSGRVAGVAITALTGDVTAPGPGSTAATVALVGGSTAANVHSAELLANAATSSNTASTIVKRDSSGNSSHGTLTATNATVTASGAASTPAVTLSGAPYTAGSATTNKALMLIENAGTSAAWNAAGTYLGINAATGFTGNLLDTQLNGVSKAKIDSTGLVTGTAGTFPTVNATSVLPASNNQTLNLQLTRSFSSANSFAVTMAANSHTESSGANGAVTITPTVNQTSTAGFTDLLINRTQTAVGSGAQYLLDLQVGGSSKLNVDNNGNATSAAKLIAATDLNLNNTSGASPQIKWNTAGATSLDFYAGASREFYVRNDGYIFPTAGLVTGSTTVSSRSIADSSGNAFSFYNGGLGSGFLFNSSDHSDNFSTAFVNITNPVAATKALVVKGWTAQSANLFEAQNVSGTTLASIDASGDITAPLFTGPLTGTASGNELPLTFNAPITRSTNTISMAAATDSVNGYLTSTDHATFNNKQATVSIGALDAQAENANGLALVSNVLSTQSADATHPGVVNNTAQTLAGIKTFNNKIITPGTSPGAYTDNMAGITVGSIDINSRVAVWNNASLGIFKAGYWTQDNGGVGSENLGSGFITYGAAPVSGLMNTLNGGYGRMQVDHFNMFMKDATASGFTAGGDWWRVDATQEFYKANDGSTSFSVQRATGNTIVGGTLAVTGASNFTGNVGIGAAPASIFTVNKAANDTISIANAAFSFGQNAGLGAGLIGQQLASSPYAFAIQAQDYSNTSHFPISLNSLGGNVGVGMTNPARILDVTGTFGATGASVFGSTVSAAGHLISMGSAPSLSGCGTSPTITGTDTKGTITIGTVASTACVATFNTTYASAPVCVIGPADATAPSLNAYATTSTTALTISATTLIGGAFSYICVQ